MVFNNKKGIELGINFIVILIIAIVVFSFGIYFTAQIFSGAKELKENIDKDTELQIQDALRSGQKVSVAPTTIELKAGEGKSVGLGIVNLLGCDATFKIFVSDSNTPELDGNMAYLYTDTQSIKNSDEKVVPIFIQVPGATQPGTYATDIKVNAAQCGESSQNIYGGLQKVFVKVT